MEWAQGYPSANSYASHDWISLIGSNDLAIIPLVSC